MVYGHSGEFARAAVDFEAAVLARDPEGTGRAFMGLRETFGRAGAGEVAGAGPRLAGVVAQVPAGPRAVVAVIVGACVERGADPVLSAPGLFDGLRESLEDALEFCALWEEGGGGDVPMPDDLGPSPEVVERVGGLLAEGWWGMPQWQMAALAHLNHPAVRRTVDPARRREALALLGRVSRVAGDAFKGLAYALRVLDDEQVVVLHRESGTGYAVRISGIGDNFQLHTLLADALVGGGHVAGHAPSAAEVDVCRDRQAHERILTTGSFMMSAPDGERVWNEGDPSDIPLVDGARLLVLDPPPYPHTWPSGRFFPDMAGDLVLERVLAPDEAARWFARVAPAAA
ncbi:hypothetical protein [Streptomyces sp. NPDC050504]|uniref:hypothetical protein n=1 Tax=Streptomyces sp. NPDC050504 TaxID=3365618 RepID=UPI0037946702